MKLTIEFNTAEELKELLGKLTKDFNVGQAPKRMSDVIYGSLQASESQVEEAFLESIEKFRNKGWAITMVHPEVLKGVNPYKVESKMRAMASEVIFQQTSKGYRG